MKSEKLLTIGELAEILNVRPSWIYFRTMQKGDDAMPRVRVGKYLRFDASKVLDWIEKQYGEAGQ